MARRRTPAVASGPHHSAHSTTSPPSETHSASASSGSTPCGTPGASLAPVAGTRPASSSTNGNGGDHERGSSARPVLLRRAGSTNAASTPARSVAVTSSQRTSTRSATPAAAAFAAATSAVSGSRSTPTAAGRRPGQRAPGRRRSRSTGPPARRGSTAANRRAWPAATAGRVACSRPSAVNHIRSAAAPSLVRARARSRAWVSAAAARSGSTPSRRSWAAAVSGLRRVVRRDPREQRGTLRREQRPEGLRPPRAAPPADHPAPGLKVPTRGADAGGNCPDGGLP